MSKYLTIRESIAANELLTCTYCNSYPRTGISRFCKKCDGRRLRCGDCSGFFIKENMIHYELRMAKTVVAKNLQHAGIMLGIQLLADIITAANDGTSGLQHANRCVKLLYLPNRSDLETFCVSLLIMGGAVMFFDLKFPGKLRSHQHLRQTLAVRLFRLGPAMFKPSFRERDEFGQWIMDRIGVLLTTIAKGCADMEKQQEQSNEIFESPMEVSING